MQLFLKISQQTSWQILGKVVTSLSTFIILGIVTRTYGQEGTGIFTLALTYLAIFYLLADFGFNAHVLKKNQKSKIKFFNEEQNEWNRLLGVRILWSLVLIALAVGLLPFWPFASSAFNTAILIGSLAILGSAIFISCNLTFQSKLRYDLSVLASSIGTIISLLVFLLLSFYNYPVAYLLFAHLVGWMLIAFASLVLVRKFLVNVFPIFDKHYILTLFKDSWPIAATLALNVVYFRADSFMIAYFKDVADVGIYNIAYSVFQSALVIPTFVMNAYYPLMLKSFMGVKKIGLALLGISLLGTMLTIILAPFFIQLLAGEGFWGSVTSLQILSLGFPAYFLSALFMWVLVLQGRYKLMLLLYTSGLIFNLILNFIFIPKFSFFAASWITVFSEYLILAMQVVVVLFGKKYETDNLYRWRLSR